MPREAEIIATTLKHKGKSPFKNAILEGSARVTQECTQFSWFSLEKAGAAKLEPLDLFSSSLPLWGVGGCRWRTALAEYSCVTLKGSSSSCTDDRYHVASGSIRSFFRVCPISLIRVSACRGHCSYRVTYRAIQMLGSADTAYH